MVLLIPVIRLSADKIVYYLLAPAILRNYEYMFYKRFLKAWHNILWLWIIYDRLNQECSAVSGFPGPARPANHPGVDGAGNPSNDADKAWLVYPPL